MNKMKKTTDTEEETMDFDLSDVPDEIWSDYETDEYCFYKNKPENKVWHAERKKNQAKGVMEFTFDQKKIYNLEYDYPDNMTKEEVEIFKEEYPNWAEFYGRGRE